MKQDYIEEVSKNIILQAMQNDNVSLLMNKIKEYDNYTYNHCINVAYMSVIVGFSVENMNQSELTNLAISALVHDVGKCNIDENIINKPGKLTEEEYEKVKHHPTFGYDILNQMGEFEQDILKNALLHHENYDGTGYPYGLKNDQIPLSTCIIHVCDVYDALISKRSYKNSFDKSESIQIIKNNSGTMFNPKVVDAFLDVIQLYDISNGHSKIENPYMHIINKSI